MAKKFSEFTEKTTIADTDVFLLSENGGGTKKITGPNLKKELGGGVSQNYSTSEQALKNSDGTPLVWVDGKQIYQKSYSGDYFDFQDEINVENLVNSFATGVGGLPYRVIIRMAATEDMFDLPPVYSFSGALWVNFTTTFFTQIKLTVQYTKI